MKVALFDFCETLVTFQTADAYIDYCRKRLKCKRMLVLNLIRILLVKIRFTKLLNCLFPDLNLNKRIQLFQLYGIQCNLLDTLASEYYENCIKASLITPVINELIDKKRKGYKIWVISGGYDIYIKYFVRDFKLDGFISSKIKFSNNGRCLGVLDGIDCLGENKILLIEKKIDKKLVDKADSYSYSDSITDLPMLLWTANGVVVSKRLSQYWAKKNKFKEIIWD